MYLLIAALERLWKVEAVRIANLARGKEGHYTAAQYADAAVMLLDTEHHAIVVEDLLAQLGRRQVGNAANQEEMLAAGERAFEHLVEANALSLRPQSGEFRGRQAGQKTVCDFVFLLDSSFDP